METDSTIYPRRTEFGKANCGSVIVRAWFDVPPEPARPALWLESKDGDRVCVPSERMETLKRLIRRGRNP